MNPFARIGAGFKKLASGLAKTRQVFQRLLVAANTEELEEALLAVSLLFAFYRVKPAPFCFLDEVDAPLDDANVGRFADYLKGISDKTQVVIITHNRVTVERADVVFGVTAEEPGVSKLIAVSLEEYRARTEPALAPA